MTHVISINNLTKYYGKERGIIDVSFDVEPGEIFGFIGPNGAGKSTTIRTLLALIYPTSGSASIFGLDCIRNAPKIAERVGYLPSEVFYYDGMRVRDLLSYSAGFYKKDCTKRITDLSERLDLDLTRKIEDLSFGNKKKVAIVQGLIHSPDLIILDEPTLGLDPLMQQEFFTLLEEENSRGATILMSSHILSEVQKICSRVAIIKEGKIVKVEKISTLKNTSYLRVHLESDDSVEGLFSGVEGVSDFHKENGGYTLIYRGNINILIRSLSRIKLRNIRIEEPELEEIFLHYYAKEGEG